MTKSYTKYFDNCKAVFQGGGCKAVAYVGAYEEAYARGVFFSELSGASAGALIAALIAAGAKPDYLRKVVMELDFSQFVTDYQKPGWFEKRMMKYGVKDKSFDKYTDYISISALKNNYGIFDMKKIYTFVNDHLKTLSGKDILTFQDLTPDLHIVCADLYTHKIKTWNRKKTPEESVAKAVCCSCAIPIFFKPVDGRYVDGGVLCNLPNFIFADEPNYNKILSFRFKTTSEVDGIKNFADYCKALGETVVEGSDKMHELLNLESYDISIEVNDITATDFDKLTEEKKIELMDNGRKATEEFFKTESVYSFSQYQKRGRSLTTMEQVWSLVAYLGYDIHKEIIVSCDDTYWSWYLFPTMLKWVNNGSDITVYTVVNSTCDKNEESRRRVLKALGINLIENNDPLSFKGFFFKGQDHWKGVSFDKNQGDAVDAKFYSDWLDSRMIGAWVSKLHNGENSTTVKTGVKVRTIRPDDIIRLLKNDPIYATATMKFQNIKVTDVVFMNPFIRALKYKQIGNMFELYQSSPFDIAPFSPTTLVLPNKKESIIGPPVVEYKNGKYYVIEGNTRFVYAYRHGIESLNVLVVSNVTTPLPCNEQSVVTVDKVLLSDRKVEGSKRYGQFDYSTFRHIEACLRPNDTYLM